MSAPLPMGWISQYDPQRQRYFFVDTATGRSQWEDPRSIPPPMYQPPPPPQSAYGPPPPMAAYGGPPAPYGGPAPYMTPQPYPAQYPPAQAQAPVIIPQQPQAPARGNHSTGAMLGAGAAGAAAALLVGGVAVAGYEHLRHEYDPDVVVVQQPVFEYGPTTIIENNETIIYNDNEYNDYH